MTKLTKKKVKFGGVTKQEAEGIEHETSRCVSKLLFDYDCDISFSPGKANVIVDALSRKVSEPPLRVRVLVMTIGLDLLSKFLNAKTEARKPENIKK
ncbi:hypothetical protein Tco_1540353 [Tanacetum coccineum]